jgi:hypothetical protein
MPWHFSSASRLGANTITRPESSTSTLAPVVSWMPRITLPPGPIRSRMRSGLIQITTMRGAFSESSERGANPGSESAVSSAIRFRMCSRPWRACSSAFSITPQSRPSIFRSIWIAVMPFVEPATLKSMSPRWSSSPRMSESTALRLPSVIRPIAMPATGAWIWMPASMSASAPPQTDAIDELPFDSRISDTTRIVNGESSPSGSTIFTARSASAP